MKIYLDVCTLCRPFDDQSYLRIRMETEALNLILSKCIAGSFELMVSQVHFREISDITETKERIELENILETVGYKIKGDFTEIRQRTEILIQKGFGVADAAHVAFAEHAGAAFISCDDKLLKKCEKSDLKIWTVSPLAFCEKENIK